MVEHAAVNRRVAGSSPARGAKQIEPQEDFGAFYLCILCMFYIPVGLTRFILGKLKICKGEFMNIIMDCYRHIQKDISRGRLFTQRNIQHEVKL